jgi:Zn-dependent protease
MDSLNIVLFIFYMIALIFSCSIHEAAHAYASYKFGDDLAYSQGRVSLNPTTHIDPIGTLLFPAIGFFTGFRMLGWARPTPVNPLAWRNKRVANFWVSIAGILSNLMVAIVSGIIFRILLQTGLGISDMAEGEPPNLGEGAARLAWIFFNMNISLAIFNFLPIPPLDGSKILSSILPSSFESGIEMLEQYGFIILLVALYTGALDPIFRVVLNIAEYVLYLGL